METTYDIIIVGARCAGSPAAMLLAQKGYKVLLLDKGTFPSDTISTHIVFAKGLAKLKEWKLLQKVLDTGCPLIKTMGMDTGSLILYGSPAMPEGIPAIIAPRRYLLDKILLDAAIEAGAEFRDNTIVEKLLFDGSAINGIQCHNKSGKTLNIKGRIVIGADGRNSIVARSAGAEKYQSFEAKTCWYYAYWSGLKADDLTLSSRPGKAFGTIPTNDGLTCVPVACKASSFHEFRSDIEGNYLRSLSGRPDLYEKIKSGKRESQFYGMADLPNFFRKPYGKGWALAGDAGYHKDPITGQGISDALMSASWVAEAIDLYFTGKSSYEQAMGQYESMRNEEVMPMFEMTKEWSALEPPPAELQELFAALSTNKEESTRFFGTLAGTVKIPDFYSAENIGKIMAVA